MTFGSGFVAGLWSGFDLSGIVFKQLLNPVDINKDRGKRIRQVITMEKTKEQRAEKRMRYHWFIQYADNVKQPLSQGRMVDVSSSGAAFFCFADKNCPQLGKLVATRFSVPDFDSDKPFDSASFSRIGRVCRVDNVNSSLRRVAIQFARPLPFKPGEQNIGEYDRTYKLVTESEGITAAMSAQFASENNYKPNAE